MAEEDREDKKDLDRDHDVRRRMSGKKMAEPQTLFDKIWENAIWSTVRTTAPA